MKTMKKLTTFMLTMCIMVACFSMSVFAADGKIMFTDPQTKTGETVEITGVVQKSSGNFGKIEIAMKYDTDMLKFQNGDGITETEEGKLVYKGDATRDVGPRKEFKFSFLALKEGTTKIEITDSTIKNVSGTVLDYTRGTSTIKIEKGEGTVVLPTDTGATVEVNGASYKISNKFPENAIPSGYEAAKLEYDLVEYDVVYSEEFGLYLAYLINEEHKGDFFMYVESDATFAPYEEINISDNITIALLSDVTEIELPDQYKTTTIMLNEHDFPAWKVKDAEGFCILYAINNQGEKSLYQLDTTEGTYQRFFAPEQTKEITDNVVIEKLSGLLENHLDYVILGTGLGFLLFLLIIIILSVKLYNRNAELDEIYDEYGIGLENKTEEDVVLDWEDDDDDDEEEEITEDELDAATLVVQEGLREMQEEVQEEPVSSDTPEFTQDVLQKISEQEAINEEDSEEESLGKILEEVVAQTEKEKEVYEEDDIFENFSVDFIDLDD